MKNHQSRKGLFWITALALLVFPPRISLAAQDANESPDPVMITVSPTRGIQAALDSLPASGGVVLIPPGRYELERPLVLTRPDTSIRGAGTSTHLVNTNTSSEPAFLIQPPDRAKLKRSRIWRVHLKDFRVSGNPKSGDGIRAEGVNEIFIHNIAVDHNGGHGIHLIDCYEDPRIADSIITYNRLAGLNLVACHDIVVNGNQFEENQDALRCIDSFNLCMNGNNLDDHLRHGVVIENTYGSVVAGNMIEECSGTAVILDRDCYGNTISANVIAHNGGGVDLLDAWGCAVSANTFTMIARRGGVVVGPDAGRITITGNNFSNAWIGGKTRRDDPATGVLLQATSDIAVTGNVFTGLQGEAVRCEGQCARVVITGNVMADLSIAEPGERPAISSDESKPIISNNATEAP